MKKSKLKKIIKESLVKIPSKNKNMLELFIATLAQKILDYNDSIKYRLFVFDKKQNKWKLKECR